MFVLMRPWHLTDCYTLMARSCPAGYGAWSTWTVCPQAATEDTFLRAKLRCFVWEDNHRRASSNETSGVRSSDPRIRTVGGMRCKFCPFRLFAAFWMLPKDEGIGRARLVRVTEGMREGNLWFPGDESLWRRPQLIGKSIHHIQKMRSGSKLKKRQFILICTFETAMCLMQ